MIPALIFGFVERKIRGPDDRINIRGIRRRQSDPDAYSDDHIATVEIERLRNAFDNSATQHRRLFAQVFSCGTDNGEFVATQPCNTIVVVGDSTQTICHRL